MKKRSLFKRLLSGFVATAMALSICFSDKVFEDLFASAAEGDPSVTVKVMNDGNLEKYANHVSGTKYYVLGALVNKEDAGISVKKDNVDKIVAWDCKEIDLANKAEDTVTFETFYKKSKNYASEFDRDQDPEPYDKNKYAFIYRVFQYRVEGNNGVNPYATKGVEPTNLIAPQGQRPAGWNYQAYNEISSDQFDGYVWEPATVSGDSYTSILDKRNPELYVTVNFGKPTTVTADDHVYAVVEVDHVGAPAKTIGYAPLVTDGEGKMTATVAIQAGEKQDWYKENGDHSTEKFTGNEPNYKVRLFQAEKATGIKDILGGKATEYKVGDMVLGQEFLSTDKSKDEAEIAKPKYYAIATLGTVSDPDNYTYSEILGPARVFGITADRFEQINHMQTNFAANVYKQAEFRPDLSKPTGGSIYVGKLVTFDATDKTKYTEVDTPYIRFEKINQVTQHPEGYGAKLFSPYGDKVDITADGMEYVERHEMSADDIKNKVVGPAISHIQFMSDVLAKQEANYIPVKGESSYSIDTTHYPENTTIYVDADSMLNDKGEMPKLHMSLAKGQNIVFNFKNADKVKVGQFYIRTLVDGVWNVGPEPKTDDGFYAGHTGESQKWDSDFNNWINEYVMRNVVFNFNKATDVEVGGTAGLFIVKNPNSETVMKGTTTGWMATAGYFQKSDGEWHFPYDDVGDYKEPVPADFVISKTSITNNKEIEGATIQIIDAERPQGDWDYMVELNKEQGVEAVIEGGKTIGITWTSSGTAKNIKLSNGNYTFRETGDEFTSKTDGKKYKVVTSETNFVVASGKVVKEPKDVTEDNGTIKYTKTNNTITISDAQAGGPVTHPVHVSKTEITGQKAVAGATITVYTDTPNAADRVKVDDYETRAVDGSKKTFALEAGKYVLVEKATVDDRAPSLNGKTYKVITTEFKFEVKEDGTVECTGAKASVDNFTADEKANGGLVLTKLADNNEPYFIMCDAANTTNITVDKQAVTGEHTIKNARLWLTDSNRNIVPGADITTVGDAAKDKFTVALEDGEYTVHEEAAKDTSGKPLNITDENGDKYNIIPSEVKFTVENGTVTKTEAKASKDELGENGGVFADGTTFHVCDAVKPKTAVTISKTDVTGNEELKDATLTLFYANEDGTKGAQVANPNNPWTSDGRAKWTVQLQEGKYILEESGTKVTDKNNWEYDVLNSAVAFTIGEDGKIAITSNNSKTDFDRDNSSETGFAVAKNTADREATLTICDAAKKTPVKFNKKDITGQEELAGATLTVYKYDATKEGGIGERVNGAVSSKDAGSVFELELANGKYVLKESGDSVVDAAGNKYDIIETTLTFEVNNGTVTATGAKPTYDSDATTGYFYKNGTTIEICDAKKVVVPDKLKVKVDKTAVTGEAVIENAHLKIVDSNNVVKGELITTKTKKSFEVELEDGTYTLTETAAEGKEIVDAQGNKYEIIPSSVTFTIENGQITSTTNTVASKDKVDQNKGGVVYSENTFTICDAVKPKTAITISKTDVTGKEELAGATLTLFYAKADGTKGDKVVDANNPWTSNGSAKWTVQLQEGKYILEESGDKVTDKNNWKYDILNSAVAFTIGEDGKITVTSNNSKTDFDSDNSAETGFAVAKNTADLEATLTICDAIKPKTSVKISKTDVTGNEELKDATLTLFYAKADGTKGDKVVDANNPWTSNGSAKWTVQLQEGDYILKESGTKVTDENGWEYDVLNTDVAFSIDKDGKIAITSNNSKTDFDNDNSSETGFAVAKNVGTRDAELTICDAAKKTPVKFNKKDITGQEELEGATLTVYKYDATKEGGIGEVVNEAVSSKEADSVFELELANGKYVLKESGDSVVDAAGNKYDIIETTLTFEVNNGTVTANDAKTAYESNATTGYFYKNGTTIEICDAKKVVVPEKLKVKVDKKAITGDAVIENAHLKIVDSNNIVVKEVVTSKTKTGLEAELEDGTYTLTETAAEGKEIVDAQGNKYEIIPSSVTFTIENGQIVSATNTVDSKDKVDQNKGGVVREGTTFTICDAKKVVVPDKLKVKVDKTAVTGEAVIENAHLKIVDSNNVVKGELITTKTDKSFEVELEDGTYTLTEEAVEGKNIVDAQGNKYEIIPSSVKFTIENGQITSTTNTVDSKDKVDQNKGGVVREGTTFTICDAKKVVVPEKLKVKVDKKAITGDAVIENAVLKIVDSNNTVVKEVVTSKTETGFEVELEDGTYTLTETAAEGKDIVDAQGNKYEIIPSSVTFTIENGQITSTTNTVDSKDKVDQNKGGVVREGTTFTICDAKKATPTPTPTKTKVAFDKKTISGDEELAGATLTVYKYDATKEGGIGEKVDEAVSSKDAGSVFELELENGKYVLKESGDSVVDAAGNKYDIIETTLTFEVNNGTVTATGAKTAYDDKATTGYFYKSGTTIEICDAKKATPTPTPTKTKVVFDKKTITGQEELEGAILTITKKGESTSQSWTSQIGKTWEVELEEGTYVLTESGDSVVDKDGNKYDVITSELEFTVNSDGTVTATGAKTAYDDKATTGYFYQNGTTIEICDAKKATSDDDSSKPSDDSSKPSGGDNDGDNDSSKGNKPSGGDNDGDNDSNKGKKPSGGDEDGDNTPNTGFAGSTFAAAALLAAVSVLAVMKKKDE